MDLSARQLDGMEIGRLDQSESYQYNNTQLVLTVKQEAVMEKLRQQVTSWSSAVAAYDEGYRRLRDLMGTAHIQELDKERDPMYSGLYTSIKSAQKSPIAAQREAGDVLADLFYQYRVDTGGEYEQETMRIAQLCQTVLGNMKYTKALQVLGLKEWAEALQAKNQEFDDAMRERTASMVGYEPGQLVELRRAMEEAYRTFRKALNVLLIYEGDEAYAGYVDQLNAEVYHYKQIIARKGSGKKEDGSDTNPDTNPDEDPSQQDDEKQDDEKQDDEKQDDEKQDGNGEE